MAEFISIDETAFVELIKKAIREELKNFTAVSIVPSQSKPITTKELCRYLGVSEPTILRWRTKGKIPFFTIGSAIRFNLDEVVKSLEK